MTDPVDAFVRAAQTYMVLDCRDQWEYVEVIFGTCMANRINTAPTWMHIVGPPSCGKTQILEACGGHGTICIVDSVSRRSFISGLDERNEGTALLPKLHGKVGIIPDLTVLFSLRSDELREILGYLRQIYDGKLRKHITGVGMVEHEIDCGMLTGCTGAIDRHKIVLSEMGERFMIYRIPEMSDLVKRKQARKALEVEDWAGMKRGLKEAAWRVLDCDPAVPVLTELVMREVTVIASFACRARAHVPRDRYSHEPGDVEIENYGRLSKQLCNLARGIAMARGQREVGLEHVRVAQRAALSSAPRNRIRLIWKMLADEWLELEQVVKMTGLSEPSAERLMQDLEIVGLVGHEEVKGEDGRWRRRWELVDRAMLKRVLEGD